MPNAVDVATNSKSTCVCFSSQAYCEVLEGLDSLTHFVPDWTDRVKWKRLLFHMVQRLSWKKAPGIQPKKDMALGVHVYIRWGMGQGTLFSRILLDLCGRKTSG